VEHSTSVSCPLTATLASPTSAILKRQSNQLEVEEQPHQTSASFNQKIFKKRKIMSDLEFDDDEQLLSDHEDEIDEEDEDQGGEEEDAEDGDEELFGGDETVRGGSLRATKSYQVLEKEQLISESSSLINETKEVLGLPSKALTAVLLRHFKWNKEKLIERYMEQPEKVLESCGLTSLILEKKPKNPNRTINCLICLEDIVEDETFALACGYRYCRTCWSTFLEMRIEEGAESVYTRCMSPGCKEIVHEEAFKTVVTPALFKKYSNYLLRSFVEDNPQIKWCPAPGCENAVRCDLKNRTEAVNVNADSAIVSYVMITISVITCQQPATRLRNGSRRHQMNLKMSHGLLQIQRNVHNVGHPSKRMEDVCTCIVNGMQEDVVTSSVGYVVDLGQNMVHTLAGIIIVINMKNLMPSLRMKRQAM